MSWINDPIVQKALQIAIALIVALVGWRLSRYAGGAAARLVERRHGDLLLAGFLRSVVAIAGFVAVTLAALQLAGLPITSFVALLGAAGLAVGLALKDSLGQLASGVMLMVLRPFHGGETIRVGEHEGVVEHVGLFQTLLRTGDNRLVTLPNSVLTAQPVINFSRCETRRIDIALTLAPGSNIAASVAAVEQALRGDAEVLASPAPSVTVSGFSDLGLALSAQAWVKASLRDTVRSRLLLAIAPAVAAAGGRYASLSRSEPPLASTA